MDWEGVTDRLLKMSEPDRQDLDRICYALESYIEAHPIDGMRAGANREVALACVELYLRWNEHILEIHQWKE